MGAGSANCVAQSHTASSQSAFLYIEATLLEVPMPDGRLRGAAPDKRLLIKDNFY